MDLLEYYRGNLTARRLNVLIDRLPFDSATARSINGDSPVWSVTDHLIADLWCLILQVNSEKGSPFVDQPRRVEMENAAFARDKESRLDALKASFRARKLAYGMDV